MRHVLALLDLNNFYASAEAIFDPTLASRPVIVLSSNDGNVVARNGIAKELGIQMGVPLFEIRDVIRQHTVVVKSSNFSLYADLSERFHTAVSLFSPRQERFSIDESFLDVSFVPDEELVEYGKRMKATVAKLTGLPCSVSFAPNKTLLKIGMEKAKRLPAYAGVCSLIEMTQQEMDALLETVDVEDIWNIGKHRAIRLQLRGIMTARQLRDVDILWVRKILGVVGVRIALELQGNVCLPLETVVKPKQGIMASQSFSRPIETLAELEEAVATYTNQASIKLRKQRSLAGQVQVFIHTNYFRHDQPQYANGTSQLLLFPTSFTPTLIEAARDCVRRVYQQGYQFKKAGVYITQITPQDVLQPDLFSQFSFSLHEKQRRLMDVVDDLNLQYGRETIYYAAMGIERTWQMKQTRKSPHYTTRWEDILKIHSS